MNHKYAKLARTTSLYPQITQISQIVFLSRRWTSLLPGGLRRGRILNLCHLCNLWIVIFSAYSVSSVVKGL